MNPRAALQRVAAVAVAVATLAAAACDDDKGETARTTPTASPPTASPPTASPPTARAARYALRPTAACLRRDGAGVESVRPDTPREKAFADVAQRTSIEARYAGRTVLLAFAQSPSQARLLADVLRVPDDRYVIRLRGNVVAMHRRGLGSVARRVETCLRPRRRPAL